MSIDRRTFKGFRVGGPAIAGETVRASRSHSFRERAGHMVDVEQARAAFCNSCRRVMNEQSDVGAVCNGCQSVICAKCYETRCALCNQACCDSQECSSKLRDTKVCRQHGFFAYLRFTFTGRR